MPSRDAPDYSDARFIGRENELAALEQMVLEDRESDGVVVLGPPGSGKTALLNQFMRRHGKRFPGGVEYVTASPGYLRDLGATLSRSHVGKSLLVVDEADAPSELDLAMYLREPRDRPDVSVLLGSRRRFDQIYGLRYLAVPPMTRAEIETFVSLFTLPPDVADVLSLQAEGNPLVAQLLAHSASEGGLSDVIGQLGRAPLPTILAPDGRPLRSSDQDLGRVEATAGGISDALIKALADDPELMYEISPRRFEELVADLYSREGYEVELTPVTGDGGVDLYAVQRTPFGSFLTVVDCKRYRKDRPVGVGLVRQLYGTVEAKDASVGVLATTSTFTKGAEVFQRDRRFRLGLQDFLSIHELLLRQGAEPPPS